jgi:hypothetical protein
MRGSRPGSQGRSNRAYSAPDCRLFSLTVGDRPGLMTGEQDGSTCGLAITLCSVGVGTVTRPLTESRSRVSWLVRGFPARGGWCGGGGLQVAVQQGDGGRAFAYRGSDPFDRSLALLVAVTQAVACIVPAVGEAPRAVVSRRLPWCWHTG